MPPKPKFLKSEIVNAALDIVSKDGIEALSARELGRALGSSSRPVFTVFDSMEQVQSEVVKAAMQRFESYAERAPHDMPLFKSAGMQMLMFAREEPKLYRLLFMRENKNATTFDDVFGILGDTARQCIDNICQYYALCESDAKFLFENVWIYTFGIGALCATGACRFSPPELSEMLTTQFSAVMSFLNKQKDK